mgnify:CR=1 FL=1
MRALPLSATLILLPAAAMAHPGTGAHGAPFLSGLAHPVLGPDHLLTMIAVGLFAAMAGGRAVWACPVTFLAAMIAGVFSPRRSRSSSRCSRADRRAPLRSAAA